MSRKLTHLGALALLLAMSFGIQAFAQKRSEPIRKIDPAIENQFITQAQDDRLKEGEEAARGVRIIVHINDETNTNFNSVTGDDAPLIVAANVLDAQNAAILEMTSRGIITESRADSKSPFALIMLLDYQYALVGEAASMKVIDQIATLDNVNWVELDRLREPLTIEGRALVGSNTVASNGYAGSGVGVAVIDSHFDLLHPELGGSTSLPNGVVRAGSNFSDPGTSVHSQNFNDCYHGTGTASIVRRYAPSADIYALTVFPNSYDSVIANAINWCVTNKNGVNGGAPIRVISMSLGGGRNYSECTTGLMHTASGTALSNGILVFAASGNDGWTNSMGSPACSPNVISVGSVWDETNAAYSPFPPANCSDSSRQVNERTCYSDTASFLDIYAPSEEVICARCGTSGTFALGGTSSACPAAAGMTAQFLSHPSASSYIGNKSGLVSLYQSTGVQVVGDTSKRRINLLAAVNTLGGSTAPTASFSASPTSISSGSSSTLSWSTTNATSVSINNGVGSVATSGSVSVSPTATTTYTLTATGAGGTVTRTATVTVTTSGGNQLANGVSQSVTLATGATTTYTIAIPANASNLTVAITGSGDLDLYVKDSAVNWPSEQGSHNTATFKAPYIGGSSESVTFPSPAAGTWHVLIHGYSGGSGTVTASWTVGGGSGTWTYETFVQDTPHNYLNSRTYEFVYEKAGASQVAVHFNRLDTETNYDFVYVYDENDNQIFKVSGNLINSGSGSAFGRTDGWCVVTGSKIRVRLVTDSSVRDWGYRTDQAAYFQ